MNDREFEELSAGHALGALSAEDERLFQQAVRARPDRVDRSRDDEEAAAMLADAVTPVTPPPALRDSLLARIAVTPQVDASPVEDGSAPASPDTPTGDVAVLREDASRRAARPLRASRLWFALAASIALVVAIGAGVAVVAQQTQRPAAVVALEQIERAPDAQTASSSVAGGGDATLHWSPSLGKAVLVSEGLPALASDQSFELWFVRDGEPVSAGVFDASGSSTTAELAGRMEAGDIVAVTVEAAGGSPSGQPTSTPIVAIPTA
ncbi:anti-sigma factor [Microbacterium sp. SORGH_AS_0888]|uniref:anti-sigma factor n=1 Tax=Microbacterium sp. SORGH_AS_0888 TaxID=3041791 RepID=UPI00277D2DCE|nr:anti-sigma factor [Microbacterium sp. SORGH_AS_0888]MDQ1131050.1 anti-sigma-K factor RskA [Microbacterium sp. SORGH_AS_0888]